MKHPLSLLARRNSRSSQFLNFIQPYLAISNSSLAFLVFFTDLTMSEQITSAEIKSRICSSPLNGTSCTRHSRQVWMHVNDFLISKCGYYKASWWLPHWVLISVLLITTNYLISDPCFLYKIQELIYTISYILYNSHVLVFVFVWDTSETMQTTKRFSVLTRLSTRMIKLNYSLVFLIKN